MIRKYLWYVVMNKNLILILNNIVKIEKGKISKWGESQQIVYVRFSHLLFF